MICMPESVHYRRTFLSPLVAKIYDFCVWAAVLGRTRQFRANVFPFVPGNAKVAVDIATGTGGVALALKGEFPKLKLFACDLSEQMLAVAERKAVARNVSIVFSVQDVAKTSYPSGMADFAVVSLALHEMPHAKRLDVMREAFRLLRKGGVFAVCEYHAPKNLLLWIPLLFQFFLFERVDAYSILKEDLQGELCSVGFRRVVKKTYYGGMAQIVAGGK